MVSSRTFYQATFLKLIESTISIIIPKVQRGTTTPTEISMFIFGALEEARLSATVRRLPTIFVDVGTTSIAGLAVFHSRETEIISGVEILKDELMAE